MMDPEEIKRLLEQGLTDAQVEVKSDDGVHFATRIVSPDFEGLTRVACHRLVYDILGGHIDSQALHAIAIRTLTPGEG